MTTRRSILYAALYFFGWSAVIVLLWVVVSQGQAASGPPKPVPPGPTTTTPDPLPAIPEGDRGNFLALIVRQQNILLSPSYIEIQKEISEVNGEWKTQQDATLKAMHLDDGRHAIQATPKGEIRVVETSPAPQPANSAPAKEPAKK